MVFVQKQTLTPCKSIHPTNGSRFQIAFHGISLRVLEESRDLELTNGLVFQNLCCNPTIHQQLIV